MSIQSITNNIENLQRDSISLNKQLASETSRQAANSKRTNSIRTSITRTTSASTLQSKYREIERLDSENAQIQVKIAYLTKRISEKTSQIYKYQEDLSKEQAKQRKHSEDSLRKVQLQLKQRENDYLSGLRSFASETASITASSLVPNETEYDAFISHASEDKEEIVRPLAEQLRNKGYRVWYDEFELKVGDSLRRKIDRGLSQSRYGIVVLSQSFFAKNWPQYELDGLVAKEITGGKVILPIWHKVSKDEVFHYSPTLADRFALTTSNSTLHELADKLSNVLQGF